MDFHLPSVKDINQKLDDYLTYKSEDKEKHPLKLISWVFVIFPLGALIARGLFSAIENGQIAWKKRIENKQTEVLTSKPPEKETSVRNTAKGPLADVRTSDPSLPPINPSRVTAVPSQPPSTSNLSSHASIYTSSQGPTLALSAPSSPPSAPSSAPVSQPLSSVPPTEAPSAQATQAFSLLSGIQSSSQASAHVESPSVAQLAAIEKFSGTQQQIVKLLINYTSKVKEADRLSLTPMKKAKTELESLMTGLLNSPPSSDFNEKVMKILNTCDLMIPGSQTDKFKQDNEAIKKLLNPSSGEQPKTAILERELKNIPPADPKITKIVVSLKDIILDVRDDVVFEDFQKLDEIQSKLNKFMSENDLKNAIKEVKQILNDDHLEDGLQSFYDKNKNTDRYNGIMNSIDGLSRLMPQDEPPPVEEE